MKNIRIKEELYISYDEKNIIIYIDGRKIELCNECCSEPSLNVDKNKLVFISPLEWEEIGKLMIYDIEMEELKEIKIKEIPEQHTIKKAQWLNNHNLIMIVGFAYGTVTLGGNIYTYDLDSKEFINIYANEEMEEVKDFNIKEDNIELEIITFDKDYDKYKVRNKNIEIKHKEVMY